MKPTLPLISKYKLNSTVLLLLFFLLQHSVFSKSCRSHSDTLKPAKILYIFTGSDWCPNCIKFKRKIYSDTTFNRELQKLNIKIQILDFPQHTVLEDKTLQFNQDMAEKLNFDGVFPTFTLANPDHLKFKNFYFNNENMVEFIGLVKLTLEQLNE